MAHLSDAYYVPGPRLRPPGLRDDRAAHGPQSAGAGGVLLLAQLPGAPPPRLDRQQLSSLPRPRLHGAVLVLRLCRCGRLLHDGVRSPSATPSQSLARPATAAPLRPLWVLSEVPHGFGLLQGGLPSLAPHRARPGWWAHVQAPHLRQGSLSTERQRTSVSLQPALGPVLQRAVHGGRLWCSGSAGTKAFSEAPSRPSRPACGAACGCAQGQGQALANGHLQAITLRPRRGAAPPRARWRASCWTRGQPAGRRLGERGARCGRGVASCL